MTQPKVSSSVISNAGRNSDFDQHQDLYNWINGINLPKPVKNFHRDLSDGVVVAEIIHHYFPRMIEMHSYVHANSAALKKVNWDLLNRKVFPKFGIKLQDSTIQSICQVQPGYLEPVMCQLKKLILRKYEEEEKIRAQLLNDCGDVNLSSSLKEANCLVHYLPNGDSEFLIFRGKKFYPQNKLQSIEMHCSDLKNQLSESLNKMRRQETLICLKENQLLQLTRQLQEYRLKTGEISPEQVCQWEYDDTSQNSSS